MNVKQVVLPQEKCYDVSTNNVIAFNYLLTNGLTMIMILYKKILRINAPLLLRLLADNSQQDVAHFEFQLSIGHNECHIRVAYKSLAIYSTSLPS